MKTRVTIFIISFCFFSKHSTASIHTNLYYYPIDSIPAMLLGNFKDDYDIRYTVTDSLFTQHPGIKYHIIKWNIKEQYFIAKNDDNNPGEKNLYTRVDFMSFENMQPFNWGFCFTIYNATSDAAAETTAKADRLNPRKGCNGYPFSRMKRIDQ